MYLFVIVYINSKAKKQISLYNLNDKKLMMKYQENEKVEKAEGKNHLKIWKRVKKKIEKTPQTFELHLANLKVIYILDLDRMCTVL